MSYLTGKYLKKQAALEVVQPAAKAGSKGLLKLLTALGLVGGAAGSIPAAGALGAGEDKRIGGATLGTLAAAPGALAGAIGGGVAGEKLLYPLLEKLKMLRGISPSAPGVLGALGGLGAGALGASYMAGGALRDKESSYAEGFIAKCAEHGVDLVAATKMAQEVAGAAAGGLAGAALGGGVLGANELGRLALMNIHNDTFARTVADPFSDAGHVLRGAARKVTPPTTDTEMLHKLMAVMRYLKKNPLKVVGAPTAALAGAGAVGGYGLKQLINSLTDKD